MRYAAERNEIQTLSPLVDEPRPKGGTFTIGFLGVTTGPIAYDVARQTVAATLRTQLGAVLPIRVTVEALPTGGLLLAFVGPVDSGRPLRAPREGLRRPWWERG